MNSALIGLQKMLFKLSVAVDSLIYVVNSILLMFLSITLFLQVVYRYLLELPLPWTEEAARHALVWFGMLAMAAAARRGYHFAFRWATLLLVERWRLVLRHIIDLFSIALLLLIFHFSIQYLDIVANQAAIATGLNMRIPYAGVSVGLLIFVLFYVLDLADAVLSLFTGQIFSERELQEKHIVSILLGREKSNVSDQTVKIQPQ